MKQKRTIMASVALAAALAVQADGYGYFALRQTGGDVTTLASDGLLITFSDGKLVATQGGTTTTLSLASLDAMYFTESDAAGITGVSTEKASLTVSGHSVKVAAKAGARVSLHNVGGVCVGSLVATGNGAETLGEGLQSGIYIVNVDGTATKVVVK